MNKKKDIPIDKNNIFLQPGDFYFGNKETRISTLLGSCVAITLWHPTKSIGGMCHYMLPDLKFRKDPLHLNGKYAEDAIALFLREIKAAGTRPTEYQAKIFGGGNMFSNVKSPTLSNNRNIESVASKNTLIAPYLLKKHGINIINHDLGGKQHRKIIFEIWSGDVWLRKGG